jgi:hypothetical protein
MKTVCQIIWEAAGAPPLEGSKDGACRTCGARAVGMEFDTWVRSTFTDWDKLTGGEIICHACQFCFTDRNEQLTAITGKDKLQRMRNYSHFVSGGKWFPLSKGDKAVMRQLLMESPEVAVIAESGQKHLIFRARPGWWQFEDNCLLPFPGELQALLEVVDRLYAGGFAKAEIESGRYAQQRILQFGFEEWCELEARIRAKRGSYQLLLALFLAQRDQEEQKEQEEDPNNEL